MARRFLKMHGLGNDFVVLDARHTPLSLTGAQARVLADRRFGVGCDQIIILEPPQSAGADVFMRVLNPDGSESGACGNATRCVASLVAAEGAGRDRLTVETISGLLPAVRHADGTVTVDMGPARLDWRQIPLAEPADTLSLDVAAGPLSNPCAVNMGNPHAVFFVDDAEAVDLPQWGPQLEHHTAFPERANIEVATVVAPGRVRMRVWERGAGITLACGSGACATLVAAARRGLTGRKADIVMDGGTLTIEWREDGHVLMTGPVATAFSGELDDALLAGAGR
ncbi:MULTISPECIES: diaminopimelate epimerase [Nitrospirillum]|uniref:Diaminopimelate epimerase n=1 Tax=Nitrospirillum viridazoti CBAmc TaxID=1441467 RepID=A0A248JRC3_9PROT|nr:diaminopimelate epimerase [Nitrospirillum amazonense]ASG21292.1 diaminopimelate epimerase [Nitrospirillum amazonense CBAmc]MEC4594795.1 diaminopimelate epimerase [Nitrospirillum amazonense]TWB32957.1 diaminopimelate epimerase [Nitrospirillum amazonense]